MHCVYKITFVEREKNEIYPCYYIGSKSNCELKDGKLYQIKHNGSLKTEPYWGSSHYKGYKEIVKSESKFIEILKWFEDYANCLEFEKTTHIENDVVISEKYFNKAIASIYLNSEGTIVCKHKTTGKIIRLPKGDEKILDGTYVGVNKGRKHSPEICKRFSRPGNKSYWFGKHRDSETNNKIKNTKLEKSKSNLNYYSKISEINKERCLGKHINDETRKKISQGNMGIIAMRNIISGETIRVHKDSKEYANLDKTKWKFLLDVVRESNLVKHKCKYCDVYASTPLLGRWHNDNCKNKPK